MAGLVDKAVGGLEQWWEEDAARLNDLSKAAQKAKITIDVGGGDPPDLNPDGSLEEAGEKDADEKEKD